MYKNHPNIYQVPDKNMHSELKRTFSPLQPNVTQENKNTSQRHKLVNGQPSLSN